jgi:hypothetical protein
LADGTRGAFAAPLTLGARAEVVPEGSAIVDPDD